MGLAESSFTGLAAPALDAALAETNELLTIIVLPLEASHGVSPLAFCGETSQNSIGPEAWVTPRFGLAPQPVSPGSGALTVKVYPLGWNDVHFHRWTVGTESYRNHDLHCFPPFSRRAVF